MLRQNLKGTIMRRNVLRYPVVILIAIFACAAFAQAGPQNLSFESGEAGGLPEGWKANSPRGAAGNPGS
jgi:hypothetical protein